MQAVAEPWAAGEDEILQLLGTGKDGLPPADARDRLAKAGLNDVPRKGRRHSLEILNSQFTNPLFLVLVAAAIISYFLKEHINALVIVAIVLLNALLGFFQEYRAERALRALRKYITNQAKVIRGGETFEVDSRHLVPGDIVRLNIGDIVPADLRLLSSDDLSIDESTLTGESAPVQKAVAILKKEDKQPQKQTNMLFMGTTVDGGYGVAVVVATGKDTLFGKTVGYTLETPPSKFQENMGGFSRFLLKIVVVMVLFIFVMNALLGKGLLESFMFAVAFAIGITPEALPIVTTIALSTGALKMAKEKVIVKKLAAVEAFGNMDVLCCDKTGTLTEGKIALNSWYDLGGKKKDSLLLWGMLCNTGRGGRGRRPFGNPVDKAIWECKETAGLSGEFKRYEVVDENEFDFKRRRMSVLVCKDHKCKLIAKGAPQSVLAVCSEVAENGKKLKMTPPKLKKLEKKVTSYEEQGYVVIAVAEKRFDWGKTTKNDEKNMTLLGFLLFADPPKTVKRSLATIQNLGIQLKIISGDSPVVTRKVCTEVGLEITDGRVVTGDELEGLGEKEVGEYAEKYNVFARVTPEHKYLIVKSLKANGHVVGFLGDGVNDAPAIKVADVGISVDTATGVARDSSEIILLKKSLAVLSKGIVEGRKIFTNITKYILNTTSGNYGNMFTVALSSLFLPFIPLLPVQILLNNFLSDFPLLTISTDNVDGELLKRPRKWNIQMIRSFMTRFGIISSFYDFAFILIIFLFIGVSTAAFRSAWFLESVLSELFVVFALRTKRPFFKSMPSLPLVVSTLAAAVFSLGLVFSSVGSALFEFTAVPLSILALIAFVTVAYFVTDEVAKRDFFRKFDL